MASSGADIAALKTKLYDACAPLVAQNPRMYFNQASIFDLDVIPNNDVNILLRVTQALVDDKLFKILQSEGLAWRLRSVEEARKFVSLPFPRPASRCTRADIGLKIPQSQTRTRNSLRPHRRGR